jgi:hypothetical protein
MRIALAGFVAAALALASGATRADDVAKAEEKLGKARETFATTMSGIRDDVLKLIEDRDTAERKRPNPDLAKLKTLKAEKEALAKDGEMPKWVDAKITDRITKARKPLLDVLIETKKAYVGVRDDDKAAGVDKEIEQIKAGIVRPADAAKFGVKYYKVFDTTLTWHQAKKKCEQMGGQLAVVGSAEENEFVAGLAAKAKVNAVWLGGTDEKKQGTWVWVDGQPVKYDNWDRTARQPNNADDVEHYVVLFADKSGQWWDYPNDPKQHPRLTKPGLPGFVCQWK